MPKLEKRKEVEMDDENLISMTVTCPWARCQQRIHIFFTLNEKVTDTCPECKKPIKYHCTAKSLVDVFTKKDLVEITKG